MSWTFNPPPGWPVPPGFVPPQGWVPDPSWPPAPAGWDYWVAAEAAPAELPDAAPSSAADAEDPYRVPPPSTVPPPAGWGAPGAPQPAGGYPPGYGGYGAPAYGAPTYGAPAYGAPAYGASPYGAPAYGAPPPRRGLSGPVIALIVAVVVLLIVGLVGGAIAIGRGIGNVVSPVIGSASACEDALEAVENDAAPPSREQAQFALPDLRDSRERAADVIDSNSVVSPTEVLRPIEEVIAGYEVFAELPPAESGWSPADREAAEAAAARIDEGLSDLDRFCGYEDASINGDVQTVGG